MKNLSTLVVLGLIAGLGFLYKEQIYEKYEDIVLFSFCEKPIGFNVGQIDEEFGISREAVIANTMAAAELWNNAYTSPLFVYDEESDLDINLIFDKRQRALNQVNQQQQTVRMEKVQLNEKLAQYQQDYEMLTRAITELNSQIEYWNNRGGAPEGVYDELVEQQQELNQQVDELNQMANDVDQKTSTVNSKIGRLNNTISAFNDLLDTLPEEGVYIPQQSRIDIYFYDSEERFIHTAAHELGHALGLGHIAVEGAIMNPTTSANAEVSDSDLQELTTFCAEQDSVEYLRKNFRLIWDNFLKSQGSESY